MTTETEEKFTFGHDELRAFLALSYSRGCHDVANANINGFKDGDAHKLMSRTIDEFIKMKKDHDSNN